jgi:hypothetical protein
MVATLMTRRSLLAMLSVLLSGGSAMADGWSEAYRESLRRAVGRRGRLPEQRRARAMEREWARRKAVAAAREAQLRASRQEKSDKERRREEEAFAKHNSR